MNRFGASPPGESQRDRSCWSSLRRLISLIFAGWLPHEGDPPGAASTLRTGVDYLHATGLRVAEDSPPTVLPTRSILLALCLSSLRHQELGLISALHSQPTSHTVGPVKRWHAVFFSHRSLFGDAPRASPNKADPLPKCDSPERVVACFEVMMSVSVCLLLERAKRTDRVGFRYDG